MTKACDMHFSLYVPACLQFNLNFLKAHLPFKCIYTLPSLMMRMWNKVYWITREKINMNNINSFGKQRRVD
jgi:hypothetical protein